MWQVQILGIILIVTNQDNIYEDVESSLNLRKAATVQLQNIISSCVLPKSVKTKINKTVVLPVLLCKF
jgi:hypothetical protein